MLFRAKKEELLNREESEKSRNRFNVSGSGNISDKVIQPSDSEQKSCNLDEEKVKEILKNEINLLKEELKEDESKNREEVNRGIGEKNKSKKCFK